MYQPKTGQKCYCKKGIQRDNCPTCESTGWIIDFKLIRETVKNRVKANDKAKIIEFLKNNQKLIY